MTKNEKRYYNLRAEAKAVIKIAMERGIVRFEMANRPIDGAETLNTINDLVKRCKKATRILGIDIKLGVFTAEEAQQEACILELMLKYLNARLTTYIYCKTEQKEGV